MISDHLKDTLIEEIVKGLIGQGSEGLKPALELLMNAAMKVERDQALGASSYERTEARQGYANGYKPKELQTRMGALELKVPKVRGLSFYPQSLERGWGVKKLPKSAAF